MGIAALSRKFTALAPAPLKRFLERLESSPIGKRLARGAFWAFTGTLFSRGLNMAAMILVARLLGKSEFGELGIIQSTVMMFQTLAGFGLGWAATKYVAEFRNSDPVKAGKIIGFSILTAAGAGGILSILFFFAAPWLAAHTLAAPNLTRPLQISSLILFASTLAGTQTGVLAGFEAFNSIAKIGIISGLFSIPAIVGGAWFWGLEGAVWGMILSFGSDWLLNRQTLKKVANLANIRIWWTGCWEVRQILWGFSLPAVLGGTIMQIGNWAGNALLVNQENGYAQMGFYNAANQWFSALLFIPGILGQAAIPVLSERLGENDIGMSRKILIYSTKLNVAIILPVILAGSLGSTWIMGLYGQEFRLAWPTLVVTLIAAGIVAVQAPASQIISASAKMWMALVVNLSWSTVFVLTAAAIIDWGSLGLAVARSIAYCFYAYWSIWFAYGLVRPKRYEPKHDYT
jgi:O-antigen/teichoic acid export membrane protein